MFNHLGHARRKFGGGQGGQGVHIGDNGRGLHERPNQILALRHVYPRFAPHTGIYHSQQGGGASDKSDPAQISGRHKARHVVDHTTPHGQNGRLPIQPRIQQLVVNIAHRIECFVRLASGHGHGQHPFSADGIRHQRPIQRGNVLIHHQRHMAGQRG